ncbi:hypothetical protein BVG16_18450 [Paenibacillus selenitireducens]|jgi:hypothetical protein|uniref:Uncharacterized protein n=1 Tax=Paenibacillus selenitireducens TaxID=1324314 RepID=A0A1T2X8H8_9BACL|nr:hypothetical protein [Paenibacillus selenitireducens]OPA76189.1 hypothetical protein BVG16_18450 [Paenibacillus selenitireducens]
MGTKVLNTKTTEVLKEKRKRNMIIAISFFTFALLEGYIGTVLTSTSGTVAQISMLGVMGVMLVLGLAFEFRSIFIHKVIERRMKVEQ